MTIEWVTVGPFQENSYIVVDDATRHAVLIDPGDEPGRIIRMVTDAKAELKAIWLTHAHLDHVGAIVGVTRQFKVPVLLHRDDLVVFRRASVQARFYGLELEQPADPDGEFGDGDVLALGGSRFIVRHTPGHSPGHCVFVGEGVMLGGDLLFAGSIGRTDLPLSNPEAMEASLALVAAFDPDLVVYPGHGPPTSIGAELATNPFLAGLRTSI